MASVLLLVTATGGCAVESSNDAGDPADPDAPDAGVDPTAWPCSSTTTWGDGTQTLQTYEWDAHHNLVAKTDANDERFSWRFDPTGTIELGVRHSYHQEAHTVADSTDRELVGGRVMTEQLTRSIDGRQDSTRTTRFRYEGGLLVEKQSTGTFPSDNVRTAVSYEAGNRQETDYDASGTRLESREWMGAPWTVMFRFIPNPPGTVWMIVNRRLDDHGLVVHQEENVYHYAPHLTLDIERRPDGAPMREVWVDTRYPDQNRTVTYQTACPAR